MITPNTTNPAPSMTPPGPARVTRAAWMTALAGLGALAAGGVTLTLPATAQAQLGTSRPASRSGLVVVPEQFLRRWDPVTLFFPARVVAAPGPEDRPERFVVLSPRHPGAFTWLDGQTLQFRPSEPWPALERFTFKSGDQSFRLSTLMSPPATSIPANGAEGLDPVESITLTFPEPMPLESLAKMLKIELRPRPGLDPKTARWLTRDDVTLKVMERKKRGDAATYVVQLREPIPENTRAIVHFQLSLDDGRQESFAELTFHTVEAFRVVGFGCPGQHLLVTPEGTKYEAEQARPCRSGARSVEVELSAEPRALGPVEARNLVRFSPAVPNLTFQRSGRTLEVTGDFDWETLYQVSLHPTALVDTKGRPLIMRGASQLHLYFPRRDSFLKWRASQGIVERYGPKLVPLEGRGFDRVDLRVYPVDAHDRRFWPFPERPVVVDENARPPSPGEEPDPTSTDVRAHLKALGSPPLSRIVDLPLRKASGAATFGLDLAPHLAFLSGEKAPGTYLVGIRKLDGSKDRYWMRVQVTDLALTTFEETREVRFGVTSLSSGQPVAGATVRLEGWVSRGGTSSWDTIFSGNADGQGIVRWVPPGHQATVSRSIVRVVVESREDRLVLDAQSPPEGYRENRWSAGRGDGWLQWAVSSVLETRGEQPMTLCHMFTERPVYRPDEEVHVKGWLRRRHLGELAVLSPRDGDYQVVVQGPGDLSWRTSATFTALGGFYQRFAEKDLPTGEYSARLETAKHERLGCEVAFRMEAYRLPTFEVRIHGPDDVPLDREVRLDLTSVHYAGGPVAGRPVRWRVTQFPHDWSPPRVMKGFYWSTDTRYSRSGEFQSAPASGKEDTTSDEGASSFTLNPALEPTAQPRSYIVEATVTGDDDQTVTATRRVNALPPFVLGLAVPRFLEKARVISPKIAVLSHAGDPLEGKEVVVRLIHRSWHSHLQASDFSDGVAKYVTDVVDEKVLEKKVTSAKVPITTELPVAESGVYVVEIEARDKLGRAQTVAVDLYAGGDQPVSWQKPESMVFNVATDRAAYDPGDKVRFVLQSPFQSARVLVVVEEPGVNRYEWIDVSGGKATYEYVVKKNEVPRFPVHFVLMRGRAAGSSPRRGAGDLGKPATMASTTWVTVNPVENRVEVKLDHPARARPGDEIEVGIELSTPGKKPVAGEVTLWLVDQAVLSLGTEQPLDPLARFISQVQSYLAVRDTRNAAFGELPLAENPGGDGEEERQGEGELLDRVTVRKNFKSVPYFNPEIRVGPDGKARVKLVLPDNLTVFKLRAKVASGPDRFGYGTGSLAVRLPIVVQPLLPRFARAGDQVIGGGIARVVEGEHGPGQAEVRVAGASLGGAATRSAITFERSKATRIELPLSIATPPLDARGQLPGAKLEVTLAVERTSDRAKDAFQVELPVLPDRGLERSRILADVTADKPLSVPAVAEPARPGTLVRTVLVSSEPAIVRMVAGLDFLMAYPHGSTEARVARARTYLALQNLRDALVMQKTEGEIRRAVEETIEWIAGAVDGRGLVAYWPGAEGYVSLTAWSVELLVEAKRAGFIVPDSLYRPLLASLEAALRSDYGRFIDGESWAERVFALRALAHAERFSASYAAELSRKTAYLNLESVAEVAQAFAASGDSASGTVKGLNDELWRGLIIRLFQGREVYGGLQDRRLGARSALILPSETRTLAEVTRAMARSNPDQARLELLYDALVTLGRDDGWGSTNANASAILALADRVKPATARKDAPARTVEIRSGGKVLKTLSLGPGAPTAFVRLEGGAALEVVVAGNVRLGPIVARVETSYVPLADGGQVAPASKGFVVTREQSTISAAGEAPEKVALAEPGKRLARSVGEVIEEHVEVVSPADRAYVAVVIPLAAGLEVMNPALATSPPEAKPSRDDSLRPTYVAFLDDRVAYYFDRMPKGTHHVYFRARAATAGEYVQPPAYAEMMYDAAVFGRSAGAKVTVSRGAE